MPLFIKLPLALSFLTNKQKIHAKNQGFYRDQERKQDIAAARKARQSKVGRFPPQQYSRAYKAFFGKSRNLLSITKNTIVEWEGVNVLISSFGKLS